MVRRKAKVAGIGQEDDRIMSRRTPKTPQEKWRKILEDYSLLAVSFHRMGERESGRREDYESGARHLARTWSKEQIQMAAEVTAEISELFGRLSAEFKVLAESATTERDNRIAQLQQALAELQASQD